MAQDTFFTFFLYPVVSCFIILLSIVIVSLTINLYKPPKYVI
jgi:hypothetical protein